MPMKRKPVLKKAWDLMGFSSIKMRKPASRKLFGFDKTKKRFRLLRHYNYAFVGEYEFSPPDSPLFIRRRAPQLKKRRLLFCLLCGGGGAESVVEGGGGDWSEIVSFAADGSGKESPEVVDSGGDEDDSVDRRAEMFIQRFYADMRIQRQESFLQYNEMLHRGCS